MKNKISDNGDYSVFAEVINLEAGGKTHMLKLTSLKQNVNTVGERTIAEIFLSQDELHNLNSLISHSVTNA